MMKRFRKMVLLACGIGYGLGLILGLVKPLTQVESANLLQFTPFDTIKLEMFALRDNGSVERTTMLTHIVRPLVKRATHTAVHGLQRRSPAQRLTHLKITTLRSVIRANSAMALNRAIFTMLHHRR